jgi:hypothetical protein
MSALLDDLSDKVKNQMNRLLYLLPFKAIAISNTEIFVNPGRGRCKEE